MDTLVPILSLVGDRPLNLTVFRTQSTRRCLSGKPLKPRTLRGLSLVLPVESLGQGVFY